MTPAQRITLIAAGWQFELTPADYWATCRVCHLLIGPLEMRGMSPKGTPYHGHCVMETKIAQKVTTP